MRRHVAHLIKGGKIKSEAFKTAASKPLFFYCLLLRQLRTQLMQVKMAIGAIGVFYSTMSQLFRNNPMFSL